jgi:hypothetical protein
MRPYGPAALQTRLETQFEIPKRYQFVFIEADKLY